MSSAAASGRGPARLTLGAGTGLCIVVAGWLIGLRPLSDNSFLTHLATGRLILDQGSVPSVDPYTFTAPGAPWVVQSWLASVVYATAEALGGVAGLRLVMALIAATVAALAWRLTRPAPSLLVRLGLALLFIGVSAQLWGERPFMLGLAALACVVLTADGALDPRWMVPLGWVWVNVHGSFPLGLVYVATVAIGRRLDGRTPNDELRTGGWLLLGVLLGAVGPLGLSVLLFPFELLERQDVLRSVLEWRAPTFDDFSQRLFIAQVALAIVLLVRRPSYRSALVLAVFTGGALLGARNLSVASLLILPAMASAAPAVGQLRSTDRGRIAVVVTAAGAVLGLTLTVTRLQGPSFDLSRYPVDALAYLEEADIDLREVRMAAPDLVGNLLEATYGPSDRVFYDDRFDMFPDAVSAANLSLVQTRPELRRHLDDFGIDLVVWDRRSPTGQRLVLDPGWRTLYLDEDWVAVCRRGAPLDGERC